MNSTQLLSGVSTRAEVAVEVLVVVGSSWASRVDDKRGRQPKNPVEFCQRRSSRKRRWLYHGILSTALRPSFRLHSVSE